MTRTVNRIFWAVALAVCAIALGSFALSFMALKDLATNSGIPPALGWVWPLIVDVSIVVYTASILTAQLQRRSAKLAISLTVFYAAVTITGNLLHAPGTLLGWFVAALPPLSLILGTEMLRAMAHHNIVQRATLDALQEINSQVDTRRQELDSLSVQIEQAQAQLEKLQKAKRVLHTAANDKMLHARQAKAEQDGTEREARLTRLCNILNINPDTPVSSIAEQLDVSRTTVYRDLDTLESQGVITKNGNGWRVMQNE